MQIMMLGPALQSNMVLECASGSFWFAICPKHNIHGCSPGAGVFSKAAGAS
jgi:hypothetical protein